MVSLEREALERVKAVLISEGYNDQQGLKDLAMLEVSVKCSEILMTIWKAPFILHELFKKAELGKEAEQRYMWGTILEEEVENVKEFFKDVEMRNQSK